MFGRIEGMGQHIAGRGAADDFIHIGNIVGTEKKVALAMPGTEATQDCNQEIDVLHSYFFYLDLNKFHPPVLCLAICCGIIPYRFSFPFAFRLESVRGNAVDIG